MVLCFHYFLTFGSIPFESSDYWERGGVERIFNNSLFIYCEYFMAPSWTVIISVSEGCFGYSDALDLMLA